MGFVEERERKEEESWDNMELCSQYVKDWREKKMEKKLVTN